MASSSATIGLPSKGQAQQADGDEGGGRTGEGRRHTGLREPLAQAGEDEQHEGEAQG
jgi:hypothetical protein